jgi:hypothetical protein
VLRRDRGEAGEERKRLNPGGAASSELGFERCPGGAKLKYGALSVRGERPEAGVEGFRNRSGDGV